MLIQKDFPTVFFDDNGVFTDISTSMLNYSGDSEVIDYTTAQDNLFFGRYKPFSTMYIEMKVVNTVAATMTVEYFDETLSAFKVVENLVDETRGLTRSGFVHFKNPNNQNNVDWIQSTTNSVEKFYLRISFDATLTSLTELQGWNVVFSDDNDLDRIYSGISNYLSTSQTTFILAHEQARIELINTLREDGHFKTQVGDVKNDGLPAQLTQWDILDVNEVNLWSTNLALKNIFRSIASNPDDNHRELSRDYASDAVKAKNVFYLTLDTDDDGTIDREETLATDASTAEMFRS